MSQILQPVASARLVPLREFVVSPGFAGAGAVVAAVIVLCAVLFWSWRAGKRAGRDREQRERQYEQSREDELHAAAVARCRELLLGVVDRAGIEPAANEGATLGLGPAVALELLRGLRRDAEELGDETLVRGVTVYLDQFAQVLAQQGGAFSGLGVAGSPVMDGRAGRQPVASPDAKGDTAPGGGDDADTPAARGEFGNAGRRHRR